MFVKISLSLTKRLRKSSGDPQTRHYHQGLQTALRIHSEIVQVVLGDPLGATRLIERGSKLAHRIQDGSVKASRIEVVLNGEINATPTLSHGTVIVIARFYKIGQKKANPYMVIDWRCSSTGGIISTGSVIDPSQLTRSS